MLRGLVEKPTVSPPRYRCENCECVFGTETDVCPDCEGAVEKLAEEFYASNWLGR